MNTFTRPKNLASVAIIFLANLFLVAIGTTTGGWSLFFSLAVVTVFSTLSCWLFLHDGFKFNEEIEFKASVVLLSSIALTNGFFSWSQGSVNLNAILITLGQSLVPFCIVYVGKWVNDSLLFDLTGILLLFLVPTYYDASEIWVLADGTPVTSLPLLVSAISAVIIFKRKLDGFFHLPFGLSKQEIMGSLFVVVATTASLMFIKTFFGESASLQKLNWSQVLPFGWFIYVVPALFSEIIYRAVFMNWVVKITGSFSLGLFVSAIAYGYFETGFMSSGNKIAFISGISLGVFNGIAYDRIGSLTVPVLANVGFIATLVLLGL